jgi:hypothetical protein
MHTGCLAHLFGPQLPVNSLWMPFLILQQSARISIRNIMQTTVIIDIIVNLSKITLVFSR